MSRQEGKSAMEEMLASIREAIHEETAHQAVGLHAPLRVRAAHEAPAMRPDNDQKPEAEAPDFLKPLSEDTPETEWDASAGLDAERTAPTAGQEPPTVEMAKNRHPRQDIGGAPFAPRGALLDRDLPSVGGIMSGTTPSPAPSRTADPVVEEGGAGDAMFDASLTDAAWWPEEDEAQAPEPKNAAEHAATPPVAENTEPLVSPQTGELAARAFDMLRQELALPEDVRAMTEEMLRPMLREWLDANLPELVERLVREEIARIAHGAPPRRMR